MAQLKDLIVTGPTRIIGTLYAQDATTSVAGLIKLGTGATNAAAGNHKHTASYTPAGSIAVNSAGSTTTVPNVTGVGSVPTTEDIACDDITA